MSWLSPKHLDDASRILRGVALVLAKAAIDSTTQRAALRQAQAAALAAANAAAAQAKAAGVPAHSLHQHGVTAGTAGAAGNGSVSPLVAYLYPHTVALLSSAASASAPSTAAAAAAAAGQQPVAHAWEEQQPQHVPGASVQQLYTQPSIAQEQLASQEQQQHQSMSPDRAAQQPTATPVQQAADTAAVEAPAQEQQQQHTHHAASSAASTPSAAAVSTTTASTAAAAPPTTSQQLPPHTSERVDSWLSGHESPTTEAEAVMPVVPVPVVSVPAAAAAAAAVGGVGDGQQQQQQQQQQQKLKVLRERRVPSTQLGRALGFAGMGASLLLGSISDSVSRTLGVGGSNTSSSDAGDGSSGGSSGSSGGVYSSFITESNAERLANALCRMRGAALKIGQMLSIQDESVLPPQIQSALERVRAGADVMPRSQLEGQLVAELGRDWSNSLASFDFTPRAAASIGQVHAAQMHDGTQVAMKIQYPGVARSIESDVDNLMRLIRIANILPKGLYVENAVKVAKRELALECNYTYEAAAQQRFRELVNSDPQLSPLFYVPRVYPELSSRQILTTEWVNGITIDKVAELPQEVRDHVGTCLLRLTLRELYEWRFMQTDPNWGNFLYDQGSGVLNLIDFGAAKQYPRRFVDKYLQMVRSCAERDRQGVVDMSVELGFLTGDESAVMLDAHTEAGFVVGLPFATPGIYDFGSHSGMTPRVAELGSIMLKHRLTPPPEESYSLHRKLSGAFLACMKLRARVPCRQMFFDTFDAYDFSGGEVADSEQAASSGDDAPAAHSATA